MCSGGSGINQNTGYANRSGEVTAKEAKEAANDLARLMERQLGYKDGSMDPVALRLFIRAYWIRVSKFAHAIHDET